MWFAGKGRKLILRSADSQGNKELLLLHFESLPLLKNVIRANKEFLPFVSNDDIFSKIDQHTYLECLQLYLILKIH